MKFYRQSLCSYLQDTQRNMLGFEGVKWSPRGLGRPCSVGKYTVETQWEQSCPSVSFCAPLNLSQCCPFTVASFFNRAVLSHSSLPFPFCSLLKETHRLMRWQPQLCQSLEDPQDLLPTFLQVLGMQIKFEMAAFRCDNYGFICKLSLLLMLRDIKISSNATIREDHIC